MYIVFFFFFIDHKVTASSPAYQIISAYTKLNCLARKRRTRVYHLCSKKKKKIEGLLFFIFFVSCPLELFNVNAGILQLEPPGIYPNRCERKILTYILLRRVYKYCCINATKHNTKGYFVQF